MKANELMIFDLVRRKKDNRTMIVVEVGYDENIGAITTDDRFYGDFEDYHETQVEPIPITPEILENNGFVYNELPFVQGWEQFGITLTIGGKGFRVNCGINVAMIIDSVHELQHALKLCGIDKEIVV